MSISRNKAYRTNQKIILACISVISMAYLLTGCMSNETASRTMLAPTGMVDIDEIRNSVIDVPTSPANYQSRRAALIRWWRFIWRQGYDMSAFDSLANQLIINKKPSAAAYQTLDSGYKALELISLSAKKIETFTATAAPGQPSSITNWPVYHGTDGSQNGYSTDAGPQTGEVAWRFPKTNGWNASVVIKNGKVYTAGADTDVVAYCLDEKTGNVIWKGRTFSDSYYTQAGAKYTPVVSSTNMLIQTRGKLFNFDLANGTLINQVALNKEATKDSSSQIAVIRNNLHSLFGVDSASGLPVWKYQTKAPLMNQPFSNDQFTFAINQDNEVVKLENNNGAVVWKQLLPFTLRGQITFDNHALYVGTKSAQLLAINQADGSILWKTQPLPMEPRAYEQFSEPLIHKDIVILGSASSKIFGIDKNTGELLWQSNTHDWLRSTPIIINDQLFVADLSGYVYAYSVSKQGLHHLWKQKVSDHGFTAALVGSEYGLLASDRNMMLYSIALNTGQVQWQHSQLDGAWVNDQFFAAGEISGQQSSPTIVDSILYIASPDGFVNAVDVNSGEEIWRFETKSSCSPSPTVAEGKVFVGQTYESYGEYFALDSKTGQPIWQSSQLGNVWISAAYDNGKLFLGNMSGDFFAIDPNTGHKIWNYFTAKDTPNENKPITPGHGHGWPPGVYCNPITKDGVVYGGSWSGYYFAWNQETGDLKWRCKTQPEGVDGGLPDSSAPVLHKNHLYVQKGGSHIAAINKSNGKVDWEWKAPIGFLQNGTVAAQGSMIYGSVVRQVTTIPYSASIYAFSDIAHGGKLQWTYRGGGGLTAPVLADNHLIFGSSADPFLTCLNKKNGKVIWRTHVGGMMLESVPAIYGKQAFALIKNGYLYAIK